MDNTTALISKYNEKVPDHLKITIGAKPDTDLLLALKAALEALGEIFEPNITFMS